MKKIATDDIILRLPKKNKRITTIEIVKQAGFC